jgi:aminoglycoside phosphotransferase family enzyme/predicted kinase
MRAPRLPDALLDPRIYPHPADDLRLVETHVSWIALAGPYAYKLKKPVRFAFLDYSTRERRRAACETELTLNRRWAPALYLDLRVLPDGERTPRWQPASAGGEPAVRMARFDRDEELDVLVARERVVADELAALGRDLAGWHAAAPTDTVAAWGGAAEALRAALDNFDALRAATAPFDASRVAALEARVRHEHAALAPWFDARRSHGRVRECHGDLHTRNVVRLGGRLVPFDAIDFAPRLRWIDVAADAAFLAMDLERLGRDDLAHAFLDAWLAAGGDYDAATGMGWLVAYRALVRAKVDALRATQLATGREAAAAWRECEGFVALAERRLGPRRGRMYATTGVSGSGKSWLAERLVPTLPAIRVRSDVERKRLAGLSPLAASGSGPDGGLYAQAATSSTYERLRGVAGTLVDAGYDVIVDATHVDGGRRAALDALAARHRTTLAWLECTAPEAVLRCRVSARTGDPSEATVTILDRQLASRAPLTPAEAARAVRIDTSGTVDAVAVAAALRVAAAPPGDSTPASAPAS